MVAALHLSAVAASALGACCAVAGRGLRIREGILALVMVAAMVDMALGGSLLPAVVWCAALILAGVLSVPGRRMRQLPRAERVALAHGAVGAILMAALLLTMVHPAAATPVGHHGTGGGLVLAVVAASLAYAAASFALPGHPGVRARLQQVSMGAATLLMTAALVVPG